MIIKYLYHDVHAYFFQLTVGKVTVAGQFSLKMEPATVAKEFVVAFYQYFFTPVKKDLIKFYDQEKAQIWRAGLNSEVAVPINEMDKKMLGYTPKRGSQVAVTSYNVMPLEEGMAIAVFGSINGPEGEASYTFTHFITLASVCDRFFIVADSFNLAESAAAEINEEEYFQVAVKPKRTAAKEEPKKEAPVEAEKPVEQPAPKRKNNRRNDMSSFSWSAKD